MVLYPLGEQRLPCMTLPHALSSATQRVLDTPPLAEALFSQGFFLLVKRFLFCF